VLLFVVSLLDRFAGKWFRPNLYFARAAYATTIVGLIAWLLWFIAALTAYVIRIVRT
jgi:hypothetical protein